jgi:hypothetical protein
MAAALAGILTGLIAERLASFSPRRRNPAKRSGAGVREDSSN